MPDSPMTIRPYSPVDEESVIRLWRRCNLTRTHNDAHLDIARKMKVNPELFLVGTIDGNVVATVIGGYEGHRGWVNYLGVDPDHQRKGLARQMMTVVEEKIRATGAPKINLQVRADNAGVVGFYEAIGYAVEDRISMGKRLVED
jgi:ribosomal protein S18 acetylase RimI-like enzyme